MKKKLLCLEEETQFYLNLDGELLNMKFTQWLEASDNKQHMWTVKSANLFLKEIQSFLTKAGYDVKIVGGVKIKGWSDYDLDLLMIPLRQDSNKELFKSAKSPFHYNMEGKVRFKDNQFWVVEASPDFNRMVDFIFPI
jgi:hypothetical protein